jgi:hypothetical protein
MTQVWKRDLLFCVHSAGDMNQKNIWQSGDPALLCLIRHCATALGRRTRSLNLRRRTRTQIQICDVRRSYRSLLPGKCGEVQQIYTFELAVVGTARTALPANFRHECEQPVDMRHRHLGIYESTARPIARSNGTQLFRAHRLQKVDDKLDSIMLMANILIFITSQHCPTEQLRSASFPTHISTTGMQSTS